LAAPGVFFAISTGCEPELAVPTVISRKCPSFCRFVKTMLLLSGDQDGSVLSVNTFDPSSTGRAFGSSAFTTFKRQFPFDARFAKAMRFPSDDHDGCVLSPDMLIASPTGSAFGSVTLATISRQLPPWDDRPEKAM
jgi:hypothetical protein